MVSKAKFIYFIMQFFPVFNFQQLLLKSAVLHDPLEIILICWFGAQKTFSQLLLSSML